MGTVSSRGSRIRGLTLRVVMGVAAAGTVVTGALGERAASAGEVVVRVAPPTPRVEVIPRAPSPHHVWAPGYWGWHAHEGRHVWYGGRWVAGRPGYAYEGAHWSGHGGNYHFVEGRWHHR
jgi:hypothetical protein